MKACRAESGLLIWNVRRVLNGLIFYILRAKLSLVSPTEVRSDRERGSRLKCLARAAQNGKALRQRGLFYVLLSRPEIR